MPKRILPHVGYNCIDKNISLINTFKVDIDYN